MPSNQSHLEELSSDVAKNGVSPHLSLLDLVHLAGTSKIVNQLFKIPLQEQKAKKLLYFVVEADYEAAKIIADNYPMLMFQNIKLKNLDGTIKTTTPLKFALELLDTYMWKKVFWEAIKNNQDYVNCFLTQKLEQKGYINLEFLFNKYEKFFGKPNLYLTGNPDEDGHFITWEELQTAWLELGEAQRIYLAKWILKEFCRIREDGNKLPEWMLKELPRVARLDQRAESSWKSSADFDVETIPWPNDCLIYNGIDLWNLPHARLGKDFTLVRGNQGSVCQKFMKFPTSREENKVLQKALQEDLETFRNLIKRRIADRDKSMLQVEAAPEAQIKM